MTRAPRDVVLRGVEKRFGDVTAVAGVDLEVRAGELLVLVGPSGCGKSTLLRLIAGLEEPTAGEVWIGGRAVNDVAPGDRDVAMVFQSYALYPHMTVARNLGFGLRVRGTGRDEVAERVGRAAGVLGLGDLLGRRPGQLSGGQQQRVALGRAMVRDPGVFLFDEPLSNLDAGLRLRTRDEIAALHRRLGTTMIFVTHDQVEALSLGQRVAVMDRGRIQQVGTPREIYRRPGNLFVAGFVGSPPINRLPLATRDDRLAGGPFVFPGGFPHPTATLAVRPEDLTITVGSLPTPAHPRVTSAHTPGTPAHTPAYSDIPPDPPGIPHDSSRLPLDRSSTTPPDLSHSPHDFPPTTPPATSPPPPHFPATVLRVESLGSEQRVHLDGPAGAAWIARTSPAHPATPGDTVHVSVAWERAHLFGPDGARIGTPPMPTVTGEDD